MIAAIRRKRSAEASSMYWASSTRRSAGTGTSCTSSSTTASARRTGRNSSSSSLVSGVSGTKRSMAPAMSGAQGRTDGASVVTAERKWDVVSSSLSSAESPSMRRSSTRTTR